MIILISTNLLTVYIYISTYRGKQIELNCRDPSLHLNANLKQSNDIINNRCLKNKLYKAAHLSLF